MPRISSTPVASVAHEGNPRTNTLTVSGTLDGDIFLIPLPPNPDAVSGIPPDDIVRPLPPPAQEGAENVFANAEGKYVFTNFKYGNDTTHQTITTQRSDSAILSTDTYVAPTGTVLEYSRFDGHNRWGCITRELTSNWYQLTAATTRNTESKNSNTGKAWLNRDFFHFMNYYNGNNRTFSGGETTFGSHTSDCTVSATLVGGLSGLVGQPISGLALAVDPASTHDDFTGIVCVVDFTAPNYTARIMTYNHQSLDALGTVIQSGNFTLLSAFPVDDAIFYAKLRYNVTVGHPITTCPMPEPPFTETWTVNYGFSFGQEISTSSITPPFINTGMRTALVNLSSSALTSSANLTDSILWKDVHALFVLLTDNTNRAVACATFG